MNSTIIENLTRLKGVLSSIYYSLLIIDEDYPFLRLTIEQNNIDYIIGLIDYALTGYLEYTDDFLTTIIEEYNLVKDNVYEQLRKVDINV